MYRSEYSEQCIVQISNFCHFCVAQTPKYFALKICTVVVYIIKNMHDLFQIFFKLLKNMFFKFFKIVISLELGSQSNFLDSFSNKKKRAERADVALSVAAPLL